MVIISYEIRTSAHAEYNETLREEMTNGSTQRRREQRLDTGLYPISTTATSTGAHNISTAPALSLPTNITSNRPGHFTIHRLASCT